MYYTIQQTPFGPFAMAGSEAGIAVADFQDGERPVEIEADWVRNDALFQDALEALQCYCAGEPQRFDLRYDLHGTVFQKRVWQALLQIPQGETVTYRDIAMQLDMPKGSRAVGSAVGSNPVSLFIPCHRVIGSSGSLTGYAGGLPIKEALLRHEGVLML